MTHYGDREAILSELETCLAKVFFESFTLSQVRVNLCQVNIPCVFQSEEVDYNANEMMKALKTDRILLNKRILLRGSKTVRDHLV